MRCHEIIFFLDTKKKATTLFSFSFAQTQKKRRPQLVFLKHREDKTHKKITKKNQNKGGSLPSSSHSAFSLLAPTYALLLLHFHFKCFLLASSSSQVKEKKNHSEEKISKKGRELTFKLTFCPLTFGSRFCPLAFAFPFQAFSPIIFFLSSRRKEKKRKEKKTIEKKKICKERRELTFKLLFCPLIFGSGFCPLAFSLSFQVLSPRTFFFSNKRKKKHKETKMAEKGRSLPFFFRFCIWDEAFLLFSPLVFSSPHSFNVELSIVLKPCVYVSSKFYVTQTWELSQALDME